MLLNDGGQGLGGNGRELAQDDPPHRADGASSRARSTRRCAERRANIKRAIHNFSLITEELGDKDDEVADFVVDSNAVFASFASQDAALRETLRELPSDAADHADHARQVAGADRRARPDARGAAPDRPRARPDPAPAAAVPAHDHADHPRRAAPVRARRRCRPSRSCARRCATSRPSRPTSRPRSRASTTCSTSSPTTRPARPTRATCSGSPGPTTWRRPSSPRRTRTARSATAS